MARPEISRVDAERLELLGEVAAGARDVVLALLALLVDQALDLLVLAGMQRREREVLELPLDGVDAEPMRQRRVDLQRLLRLLDLLLLRHRVQRAHVVQPVGELDEDDPDVRGHRDHHLAVVLGLRLVARLERDAGELGDAVDEAGDLLAERLADLLQRRRRVLDRVVQQRGAQRLGVEPHAGADLGDADRVDDEVLARAGGAGRRGARRRTRTPARRGSRSTASATSSACSSTIANRSASSSRSSGVRSSGMSAAGPCGVVGSGRPGGARRPRPSPSIGVRRAVRRPPRRRSGRLPDRVAGQVSSVRPRAFDGRPG